MTLFIFTFYLFHNLVSGYYCRKYNIPYIIRPHGLLILFFTSDTASEKALMELLFENSNPEERRCNSFYNRRRNAACSTIYLWNPGIVIPNGLHPVDYMQICHQKAASKTDTRKQLAKSWFCFSVVSIKKGSRYLCQLLSNWHNSILTIILHWSAQMTVIWCQASSISCSRLVCRQKYPNSRITITGMISGDEKLAALNDASAIFRSPPLYSENPGHSGYRSDDLRFAGDYFWQG